MPEWAVIIHAAGPGDLTAQQQDVIVAGVRGTLSYQQPSGAMRLSGPADAAAPLEAALAVQAAFLSACGRAGVPVTVTEVRVLPREQFEAETFAPRAGLAAIAEVADILGISRQQAQQVTKRPDFPRPLDELKSGQVWDRGAVERFAGAGWRRPPGRPRRKEG